MLRAIRSPVCFVIRSNDPFGNPRFPERLQSAIPHADVDLLPGGGHWPWIDDFAPAVHALRRVLGVAVEARRSA